MLWGSRNLEESSFRLHRILGALSLIQSRVEFSPTISIGVLKGANSFIHFSTKKFRETVDKVPNLPNSETKYAILDLLGIIAWSDSRNPPFADRLITLTQSIIDWLTLDTTEKIIKLWTKRTRGLLSHLKSVLNSEDNVSKIETKVAESLEGDIERFIGLSGNS